VRFILFGSLKNYSNLLGFPVAFISTYQTEFHHRLWRLPYTEVLVCHKQRVEVFHSNLSLERSWIPFRCWVSLFLTGFTSKWVSPIHVVPKRAGLTVVKNKDGELVLTCIQSGWRVCIDYRKLNVTTKQDHFPLLLIKWWNVWRGMLTTVSWMDILDTIRWRRRLSPALLACSPIVTCPLGYAMHPLLLSAVHGQYFFFLYGRTFRDLHGRLLHLRFIF
jgi:hypothetical protein